MLHRKAVRPVIARTMRAAEIDQLSRPISLEAITLPAEIQARAISRRFGMSDASHQDLGERLAEVSYRVLRSAGEAEASRRLPVILSALDSLASAFADLADEDCREAIEAARYGFKIRGAELGYLGSDKPRTIAEARRRRRVGEIATMLDQAAPNTAEQYVERLGADPETVAGRCGRLWVLSGSHQILRDFTEDEHDADFAIVQCLAERGELLLDHVAWNVAAPLEFWSLVGNSAILGEPAGIGDAPLTIHRSPAAWLAANGEGVVVLSDQAGPDLAGASGWIAEDVEHAREIARLVHPFADPRNVFVREA